jgi:HEAT repeat protein
VLATSAGSRPVVLRKVKETLVIAMDVAPAWAAIDPAGELPAEWEETGDAGDLVARLQARGGDHPCATAGRARAAVALGRKLANPAIITALASRLGDAAEADLVRGECAAALGELRDPAARAALIATLPGCAQPRIRRAIAAALAKAVRDPAEAAALAETLVSAADAEPSRWVAGELLAARAALEHPGATPVLRARLAQTSWQQRQRAAVVRGLGLSGEPAAADDAVNLLGDAAQSDAVRSAAIGAAAALGARHHLLRDRVRRAIEPLLDGGSLQLRMAAAKALGGLKEPAARAALSARLDREPFGNVRRVIRESLESLGHAAAAATALAAAEKRIDDLEAARKKFELRLEALEKRLGG